MITPAVIFLVLSINAAFNIKTVGNIQIEHDKLAAALGAALSMLLFRHLGKSQPWLKEWSLGFGLLIGLAAGQLTSTMMG